MATKIPELSEIQDAFEAALAEARRRIEATGSGLAPGFTIPEAVYADIAAKAVSMFTDQFKAGLVDAVTRLLKEGKGPTRKNPVALA